MLGHIIPSPNHFKWPSPQELDELDEFRVEGHRLNPTKLQDGSHLGLISQVFSTDTYYW